MSSRRVVWLAAGVALIVTLALVSSVAVVFPDIFGDGDGSLMPLPTLAPLLMAILFAHCLANRHSHLEAITVRRIAWWDALLLLAVEAVVALLLFAEHNEASVLRNTMILMAMAAIFTALRSPALGAVTVTVFVLLVLTYGRTAPGSRFVRVLQAGPSEVWPFSVAMVLTIAACLVLAVIPGSGKGGH